MPLLMQFTARVREVHQVDVHHNGTGFETVYTLTTGRKRMAIGWTVEQLEAYYELDAVTVARLVMLDVQCRESLRILQENAKNA